MAASFYYIYIPPRTGVAASEVEKTMNLAIDWFRFDDLNWIVYTTSDAKKWYSRLQKFVDPGGHVLVVKLDTSDYWGFMSKQLWEWLKKVR